MTYEYTRVAFRGGEEVHRATYRIDRVELEHQMGMSGDLAFHILINKWNRQGLLGTPNGGPVYVYIAN